MCFVNHFAHIKATKHWKNWNWIRLMCEMLSLIFFELFTIKFLGVIFGIWEAIAFNQIDYLLFYSAIDKFCLVYLCSEAIQIEFSYINLYVHMHRWFCFDHINFYVFPLYIVCHMYFTAPIMLNVSMCAF